MNRDNEQLLSFTRRALIVGGLQAGIMAVLGGRLAWLQVVQGGRYKTLAENNRINLKMLAPPRGRIFDRHGTALAINDQNFRALIVPEQAKDIAKVLSRLQKLVPLSQRDIMKAVKAAQKQASFVPVEVKDNLNWDDVATIEVNLPDLPGVSIDVGEVRSYPYGQATAHMIGYVGAVSQSELTGDPLLTLPGFSVGKTGVEKIYDSALRGKAGSAEIEVNVVGREVRELSRQPGDPGQDVVLTIDADLQIYMQERLEQQKSASAVIMDVHDGAVYALTSAPGFDPNLFVGGIPAEKWEEMLADPAMPLNNKALSGLYPPGSTFKMVTALAALEEGIINRQTSFYCPGHFDFGNGRFHCWKKGGHGRVDVLDALAQSCDVFFYNIATEIGIDTLASYARKLGLGAKTGFDLTEERAGLMPTRAWKKAERGESWHPGETVNASIGQGHILSTPLQLAVMTARLVNGGRIVKPWIAGYAGQKQVNSPPAAPAALGFGKTNLDLVVEGMRLVVADPKGTATASKIKEPGFEMGGKTGTAQVKRITREERASGVNNADLPWRFRHHALFVGYAPVEKPRYACAVVVEHGSSGSGTAAPVARDLLLRAQQRNPAATKLMPPEGSAVRSSNADPKAAPGSRGSKG